jgi:predicted AlkP superfamily pyrophosphatase or phosphodiesterase
VLFPHRTLLKILAMLLLLPIAPRGRAQKTQARPAVLMISVDGMRPDAITQADAHGLKVPVLRSFMKDGMFAEGVIGVVPTVTFASHATLVTGVWPDVHGIYNNTLFDPQNLTKGSWYWFEPEFKAPTLWSAAAKAGIRTASVFWPTTANASDIDYLVPAYPTHGLEDANIIEAMSRPIGYFNEIEKQEGKFYVRDPLPAFDAYLTNISIAMIRKSKPGFMTLHLVALDHAEHLSGPFSSASNEALENIDAMIGRLVQAEKAANPDSIVVVVSDHGFAATHTTVNLMIPFVQAGLITIKKNAGVSQPSIVSWKAMLWNAGGSSYVIIADDADTDTRERVSQILAAAQKDPRNGIARLLPQSEVVAEGGDPHAAFLIDMQPGFGVGGKLEGSLLEAATGTGNHGYLPSHPELRSSFFAIGAGIKPHCDAGVIDMRQIASTLAHWMSIDLPDAKQPPVNCR